MTEQQVKLLLKFIIDNSYPKLNKNEKEAFKQAIDNARTYEEILAIITEILALSSSRY